MCDHTLAPQSRASICSRWLETQSSNLHSLCRNPTLSIHSSPTFQPTGEGLILSERSAVRSSTTAHAAFVREFFALRTCDFLPRDHCSQDRQKSHTDLYERVWTTPLGTLPREFGLSDVGLAKLCRRHDIPR
jgi:hypothetical protein